MAAITAALVKDLRERTGAGMMDCKKALVACDGDMDAAIDFLREKGLAAAAKKAGRIAAEGVVGSFVCSECGAGAIVEVNCETDFVAKGDQFHNFVDEIAGTILKNHCKTLEEAKELTKDLLADATVKMGEKFDLRRFVIIDKAEGENIGTYIHMGGKIACAVKVKGGDAELVKSLAMHIAANNPSYIEMKDVPASEIEHEREVQLETAKSDPKLMSKPQEFLTKIIDGKVNKHFAEMILMNQAFLMDDSKTISQVLSENKASIVSFVRYMVGEGIEKRHDDFAAEVMKEAGNN